MRPLPLPANPLRPFYRGGRRIAELRGHAGGHDDRVPEDWVGSVTTAFASDRDGLSRLEDGRTLADARAAEPEAFLGPERARRGSPSLLVKLLDAGERLPALRRGATVLLPWAAGEAGLEGQLEVLRGVPPEAVA